MQAIELLRNTMEQIENHKVYFTFKLMKLKHIRTQTVNLMRACLSAHQLGLPITTHLMCVMLNVDKRSSGAALSNRLHVLGDKHCLVLKRGGSRGRGAPNEWMVDSVFLEVYNNGE